VAIAGKKYPFYLNYLFLADINGVYFYAIIEGKFFVGF
jgi:hypothetical protein